MKVQRWVQLDGIRGIAILSVLLFHLSYEQVVSGGFLGVDLFFALSGFLITTLLLSELRKRGRVQMRFFYIRRVLRLYPALLFAVIVAVFFWWPPEAYFSSYLRMAAAVLTYGSNEWGGFSGTHLNPLGFTWSLSIEEQFYLIWPALVSLLYRKAPRWVMMSVLGALILTAMLVRYHMVAKGDGMLAIYVSTFSRMDSIIMGSLGAIVLNQLDDRGWRPSRAMMAWTLWPGYLLFAYLLQFASRERLLTWGFTAVAVLCTSLVVLSTFLPEKCALYRLLTIAPMVYLGRRSYGLYVYHLFVVEATDRLRVMHSPVNFAWVTLLRFILIFAVTEASYRFLEMPFLRLKERFEVASPPVLQNA